MHDCRETKEKITEMVLDGVDNRQDEVLLADLNGCAECRAEFDALSATLRMTARLRETCAPAESYWVGYHAKLREKIQHSAKDFDAKAQRRKAESKSFFAPLRLCVRTTVPVPVPLIVTVVLAFAAVGLVAISGARQPASQSPSIVHVPVEVPVIQEKIVTRVVYRERRVPARSAKQTINAEPKVESTFAKFKPADEVKLTVIKGGSPYEKK
jgi:hypothetical protein